MSTYNILAWQPLLRPPLSTQKSPEVPDVPLKALSCRNAIASIAALVTASEQARSARLVFSDLVLEGDAIPASAITTRLVGAVTTSEVGKTCDPLYDVEQFSIDQSAALYSTVHVPMGIGAGTYKGKVALIVDGVEVAENTVEVEVADVDLPNVYEWEFFLNVWMNPAAVASRYGVDLWSDEHFAALKPFIADLAVHGQKTVVAPICFKPFDNLTRVQYPSLVGWSRRAGKYEFDFSVFDNYVELHAECGIDRAIHCYSIVQQGNDGRSVIEYIDADSCERRVLDMQLGDEEYAAAWGAFFEAFEKHLTDQNWLHRTYLGFGNLPPELAQKVMTFIGQYAPAFKVALASDIGNETCENVADLSLCVDFDDRGVMESSPSERSAMNIADMLDPDNASSVSRPCPEKTFTTFYVCASPEHPNTFLKSPLVESRMMPFLALQGGFDGFVRWSYNDWSDEPCTKPVWGDWPAGDTFLVYPGEDGPVSSLRWEQLREGIQDYEMAVIAAMNIETPDEMVDYEQAITLACRNADGGIKSTGDIEIARRLLMPIAEHQGEN